MSGKWVFLNSDNKAETCKNTYCKSGRLTFLKPLITILHLKNILLGLCLLLTRLVQPKLITHLSLNNSIAQSCDGTYRVGLVEAVLLIRRRRLTWKQTAAVNTLLKWTFQFK